MGVTNHYIIAEPYITGTQVCYVRVYVSLCILPCDTLVSSLVSFYYSSSIKMGFELILKVHECFVI